MFFNFMLHNYSKVNILSEFDKFEAYVEGLPEMCVLTNRVSAFDKKFEEVLIDKCKLTWFGHELHFGDHKLSLREDVNSDTMIYKKGNNFIISIPRGYEGDRTYYIFKAVE